MDDEIYQSIGEILVAISPSDAVVAYIEAELSPEGDHCKLLFDYVDSSGSKQWFLPSSARVDSDLLDLLVRLRRFFELNGLYADGEPWVGCVVELNLRNMKINVGFKYG